MYDKTKSISKEFLTGSLILTLGLASTYPLLAGLGLSVGTWMLLDSLVGAWKLLKAYSEIRSLLAEVKKGVSNGN